MNRYEQDVDRQSNTHMYRDGQRGRLRTSLSLVTRDRIKPSLSLVVGVRVGGGVLHGK